MNASPTLGREDHIQNLSKEAALATIEMFCSAVLFVISIALFAFISFVPKKVIPRGPHMSKSFN